MGNDSPPHLSPNSNFNLPIKMPKRKSRSEIGLLNSLQEEAPVRPAAVPRRDQPRHPKGRQEPQERRGRRQGAPQDQPRLSGDSLVGETFRLEEAEEADRRRRQGERPRVHPDKKEADIVCEAAADIEARIDGGAGKCSTVPYLICNCVSLLQFTVTVEHSEKCTISSQFEFQSSTLRCSNWISNGE